MKPGRCPTCGHVDVDRLRAEIQSYDFEATHDANGKPKRPEPPRPEVWCDACGYIGPTPHECRGCAFVIMGGAILVLLIGLAAFVLAAIFPR